MPDNGPLFDRMKPTLRSMEKHREEVVSKFRPLLMVFAIYAMVCLMIPYLDLGIPRNLRGNMFYFLLTIGLLSFSVVIAIYHRAHKELQLTIYQKFYEGLARQMGEEVAFMKQVPDYDAHLANDMWGLAYNHFEARNLMQGAFEGLDFSFVQATVEQRFMESMRSDKVLFDGMIISFKLPVADLPDGLIIGKGHPAYDEMAEKGKTITSNDKAAIISRYVFLSKGDWSLSPDFVRTFLNLDEHLRLARVIRKDLIVVIRNGVLTLAVPVYDRFWELVNWNSFETEEFISLQQLPIKEGLDLARSFTRL